MCYNPLLVAFNKQRTRGGFFMKRFLSIFLAMVIMVTPLCMSVVAADNSGNDETIVSPRYTYINSIYASITKGSLGFVTCTSQIIAFETNKTYVLTCYLQRCDENTAWSNYKSESKTYSGSGTFGFDKTWFAPAGYAYRTKTEVKVKNSSGTVLETVSNTSSVLYK